MTAVVLPDPTGLSHSTTEGAVSLLRQATYTSVRNLLVVCATRRKSMHVGVECLQPVAVARPAFLVVSKSMNVGVECLQPLGRLQEWAALRCRVAIVPGRVGVVGINQARECETDQEGRQRLCWTGIAIGGQFRQGAAVRVQVEGSSAGR